MLRVYSHTMAESLAQMLTTIAEIQLFLVDCFYWRTLYMNFLSSCIHFCY